MKRKLLSILVLVTSFFLISTGIFVHANEAEYVTISSKSSIRYKTENSKQGLRFYASLNETLNSDEHGFYLAFGEASLNELTTKINNNNLIHNNKEIFKVVVSGLASNNEFSVVLVDIPEHGYLNQISVISYVNVNGKTHFSKTVAITSVMDVAIKLKNDGETHPSCLEIVNKLDNYKILTKDNDGNDILTTNFNKDSINDQVVYYEGSTIKLNTIKDKHGYNGFYLIGNKRYYQNDLYVVSNNDDEFKVIYQPISYLVSFYINNEKDRSLDNIYNVEEELVLPTLETEGFVGWYDNPNFTGSVISKINKGSTGIKDFYAKFNEHVELTDLEKVNLAKDNLEISFYSGNNSYYVTNNINLSYTGLYGSYISWSSSNPSVISSGGTVSRQTSDVNVTLTATITLNGVSTTKEFNLVVIKEEVIVNEYQINYLNLKSGAVNNNPSTYLDNESVYLSDLVLPSNFDYEFIGWYTQQAGGVKVTSIPYGSSGIKTFYARWEEKEKPVDPDVEYTITFNLAGGAWPTVSTGGDGYKNRDEMIDAFFADFYQFINPSGVSLNDFKHGTGKTSGYDGLFKEHVAVYGTDLKLYELNDDKKVDSSKPNVFIKNAKYNKWVAFIDLIDEFINTVNPEQFAWNSWSNFNIRLTAFINKNNYGNEAAGALFNVVPQSLQGGGGTTEIEVPKKYKSTSNDITLPVPVKAGDNFMGWYDNAEYQGNPVTKITKGSKGNKVYYARYNSTVVTLTNQEKITEAKNGLRVTYGSGDSASSVTKNVTLITSGLHGVSVTWTSSNTGAISNTGVVKRSSSSDVTVTLTATLKIGSLTETKTFNLTVKKEIPKPTTYTITYHLDGGSLDGYKNKNEIITAFLTDLYTFVGPSENLNTFMHGSGKTSGFDGLWYSNEEYRSKIYGANIKSGNNNYFLSSSTYQAKWKPLADFMVNFVAINPEQSFWASPFTGNQRLRQYFIGEKPGGGWSDEDMKKVPQGLSASAYYEYSIDTPTITLPRVTKVGFEFLGWYTASSGGSKVTSIPKGSTGNKVFYARWKALIDPVGKTTIKGPARITLAQAEAWAKSKTSNALFLEVAKYYFDYGEKVGVRPEVLYAQMAHETGFCSFTGAVKAWQYNFAGIKKRYNNGDTTNDFESFQTAENGVRGHVNHMAAYVGLEPYGTPHGRYYAVLTTAHAGKVTYVEGLTGTWAMDPNYAVRVRSMLNELLNFKM